MASEQNVYCPQCGIFVTIVGEWDEELELECEECGFRFDYLPNGEEDEEIPYEELDDSL